MCGAEYGVRSDERTTTRNGYRRREWDTRAGTIELAIPKLAYRQRTSRTGCWSGAAARRPPRCRWWPPRTCWACLPAGWRSWCETLGISRLSKSQVSEMAKSLDEQVQAFRTRPMDAGPYTFVAADALVLKVREAGRTVNVHALLATAVNADGLPARSSALQVCLGPRTAPAGWRSSADLVARGLGGVGLVTSDAHTGPGGRDRRDPARRLVATVQNALRSQSDGSDTESRLGLGEGPAALRLRPTRRRRRARPVRSRPGRP